MKIKTCNNFQVHFWFCLDHLRLTKSTYKILTISTKIYSSLIRYTSKATMFNKYNKDILPIFLNWVRESVVWYLTKILFYLLNIVIFDPLNQKCSVLALDCKLFPLPHEILNNRVAQFFVRGRIWSYDMEYH